jgi:hypothetical protein
MCTSKNIVLSFLTFSLKIGRKEKMFKTLITKASVYLHPKPQCNNGTQLPLFTELSLKVPVETRFVYNFLMIGCMLEVKDALERMVMDLRWNEYVNTLFNWQNNHCTHVLTGAMRVTISDDAI